MQKEKSLPKYFEERKSIRQYIPNLVDENVIGKILNDVQKLQSLVNENHFVLQKYDYMGGNINSKALGGFGRLMSPPHFFVPYIIGQSFPLTDLGFRTQQIVLQMWKKGIGSCYIGCVHRQRKVRKMLGLPADAWLSAFVVFGYAEYSKPENLIWRFSRLFIKSHRRLPLEGLFLDASWKSLGVSENSLRQVLEAGRFAPSAVNAQPWRFRIIDHTLEVFACFNPGRKIYDLNEDYPLHDVGLCMANMSVAAGELGIQLRWRMAEDMPPEQNNGQRFIKIAECQTNDLWS